MKKVLLCLAITLALFMGMGKIKDGLLKKNIIEVETVNAEISDVQDYIKVKGKIIELDRYNVYTSSGGTISSIYVSVGDTVVSGQALFSIVPFSTDEDSSPSYSQISEMVSAILKDTFNGGYNSKTAGLAAQSAYVGEGVYTVLSPCSGTIMSMNYGVGESISTLYPVMAISDLSNMAIRASVSEDELAELEIGMRGSADIYALGQKNIKCRVDKIMPYASTGLSIDGQSGNISTEVYFSIDDNSAKLLNPGYSATVNIVTKVSKDVVMIPFEAVAQDGQQQYVIAIDGGNARRIDITTGMDVNGKTEVISGLSGTETLITHPDKIKKGSIVISK